MDNAFGISPQTLEAISIPPDKKKEKNLVKPVQQFQSECLMLNV